jgi:hypothetical protein
MKNIKLASFHIPIFSSFPYASEPQGVCQESLVGRDGREKVDEKIDHF